jgi:hypothetical protein
MTIIIISIRSVNWLKITDVSETFCILISIFLLVVKNYGRFGDRLSPHHQYPLLGTEIVSEK